METTRNKLTEKQQRMFDELKQTLNNQPIYFYGSIQRVDYICGYSDIDIALFSDDMDSTISRLCGFFHVSKDTAKPFVYVLPHHRMIHGKKMLVNSENGKLEIAIFNQSDKDIILQDYAKQMNLSIILLWLLYFVKLFYYVFPILTNTQYKYIKQKLMNDKGETKFAIT